MQESKQTGSQFGDYIVFGGKLGNTKNIVYNANKVSEQNNASLYILKKYHTRQGYENQKKVFQISTIYENYYIESKQIKLTQTQSIYYTICKYSNIGSLLQLAYNTRNLPLEFAKFYLHELLTKLHQIHYIEKIPFRTLYHADLIFSEEKQMYIVGWSKIDGNVSEQQVLYGCAQIFYYMLTNGIFRQNGTHQRYKNKQLYLQESFWDISKKSHPYLRSFPKNQQELLELVKFFKKLTTKCTEQIKSIQQALKDPYFNNILEAKQVKDQITKLYNQGKAKSEQGTSKEFEFKLRIKNKVIQLKKECQLENLNLNQNQNGSKKTRGQTQSLRTLVDDGQFRSLIVQEFVKVTFPFYIKMSNQISHSSKQKQQISQIQADILENSQKHQQPHIQPPSKQKPHQYFPPSQLPNLIRSYIHQILQQSQSGHLIFDQDWINAYFQVNLLPKNTHLYYSKEIVIEIIVIMKYTLSQQYCQDQQKYTFELIIKLTDIQIEGGSCIQQYTLKPKINKQQQQQQQQQLDKNNEEQPQNQQQQQKQQRSPYQYVGKQMHEVLYSKLENYVTRNLGNLFRFCGGGGN